MSLVRRFVRLAVIPAALAVFSTLANASTSPGLGGLLSLIYALLQSS